MATTITYNGVEIKDCLTNEVSVQPIPSPGGDLLYTMIRVSVVGTVREPANANSLSTHGVMVSDFPTDCSTVLGLLSIPRRRFTMTIDGATFLTVSPGAVEKGAAGQAAKSVNQMDVNNGPVPRVRLLQITGSISGRVEFTCEMAVIPCDGLGLGGVIHFRYWSGDDVEGRTWLTTRRHDGVLRVASRNFNPHSLRGLYPFLPPVPFGFERKRISYQASEDGLELRFQVIDEEKYATAPYPATEMECEYSIATGTLSTTADVELRVQLWAPKTVSKGALHALAGDITRRKLHVEDLQRKQSLFLMHSLINESLRHNRVEYISRIRAFPYEKNGVFGIFKDELGKGLDLPGYLPFIPPKNAKETASPFGLFLTALQTPCSPAQMKSLTQANIKQNKQSPSDSYLTPQDNTPVPEGKATLYQDSQKTTGMYSMYRITNDYDCDTGTISLPIGKSSGSNKVATVKMHQGFTQRRVRIDAERLGTWPELPKPMSFIINGVMHSLIHWRPQPHAPQPSADGAKVLCAAGFDMTFALNNPLTDTTDIEVGNLPFLKPLGYQLQAINHQKTYLDSANILGSKPAGKIV